MNYELLVNDSLNEVKKMLEAKDTYSLSGDAIQKLPWYE